MTIVRCSNQSEYTQGYQANQSYVVKCDNCGESSTKKCITPGNAAEEARSEGFITVRGALLSDPKNWLCPRCKEKKPLSKFATRDTP
jgi:hypothetical protein